MDRQLIYRALRQNADGSWTCLAPVTIEHPTGRVQLAPGTTLRPGSLFMGVELAEWLERNRPQVT